MKSGNKSENPLKKNSFRTYFQFSFIALCFIAVFSLFYACQKNSANSKLDYDNVELIQYEIPADDTPVAVFETDKGTFKAVIFQDEAPNTAEYFINLVNDGYYDGTHVFAVQDGVYFMGGSKTDNGVDDDETDTTQIDQELSPNLWPFRGSMISYGETGGSIFSQSVMSGSRILFVDTVEFTEDFIAELDSTGGNEDIINAFKQKGGVPNFSQQYTIFGQVYDGLDIYDEICSVDVTDSESLKPTSELTFTKVYMSTYGEHKNDDFFNIENTTSDSSEE